MPALALYQPDIPQNVGSLIRLCACLGREMHIIEPCGFLLDDKRLKRVMMDYLEHAVLIRHTSWESFLRYRDETRPGARLVFITNQRPTEQLTQFTFREDDFLLLGQESAGFPEDALARADARVIIPMRAEVRSLNVAQAGAIALAEAMRQTGSYPA